MSNKSRLLLLSLLLTLASQLIDEPEQPWHKRWSFLTPTWFALMWIISYAPFSRLEERDPYRWLTDFFAHPGLQNTGHGHQHARATAAPAA